MTELPSQELPSQEDLSQEILSQEITDMHDAISLPRENGELLFKSPWEARAFGLAVALNKQGAFPWRKFSEGLAAGIKTIESTGNEANYYEQWLKSLESLLVKQGLVSAAALEAYASEQAKHDNHEH